MKLSNIIIGALIGIAIYGALSSFRLSSGIKGSGNIIKENREVKCFEEIEAGGIFNVIYTPGDSCSLTVETDDNIMPVVKTTVKNGRLELHTKGEISKVTKLTVYITAPSLSKLDFSGASNFKTTKALKSNVLNLDFSGASAGKIQLETKTLEIDASGATSLRLSGQARTLNMEASGASHVHTMGLECSIVKVDASGASSVEVKALKQLYAEASGASHIKYSAPDGSSINLDTSGAASISRDD